MGLLSWLSPLKHNRLSNPFGGNTEANSQKQAQNAYDVNSIFGLGAPGEAGFYQGGYKNLMDLINNPGQTDSKLFNLSLAASDRNTANRMESAGGQFSRKGLQNSGLAAALQHAIASAGENRKASLTAEEARRREDLRRADTQLLYQFIQKPRLDRYANDRGVSAASDAAKSQQNASYASGAASLIGSLAAAFCHVADELYGFASEPAMLARYYMAKHADDATVKAYNAGTSAALADRVRQDPALRNEVKPIFDSFVAKAKGDFARFR